MNRRQQFVLFLVVFALMVTWLFPYWIDKYPAPVFNGVALDYSGYSFLFTQSRNGLRIEWGRLFLTDLMIVAVGTSVVYVLRSKR
jgi:hypothetical protein